MVKAMPWRRVHVEEESIADCGAACCWPLAPLQRSSAQGHRGHWRGGPAQFGEDGGVGWTGRHARRRFGRPLTKDEFDARTRERFARIDKNSDGIIDAAEIEAIVRERMGRAPEDGGRMGQHG